MADKETDHPYIQLLMERFKKYSTEKLYSLNKVISGFWKGDCEIKFRANKSDPSWHKCGKIH
jgi:hypothetical protein